jgi:hypothetical protein
MSKFDEDPTTLSEQEISIINQTNQSESEGSNSSPCAVMEPTLDEEEKINSI